VAQSGDVKKLCRDESLHTLKSAATIQPKVVDIPTNHQRPTLNQSYEAISHARNNDHAATCVALAERRLRDHPDDLWVMHIYAEMLYLMTRYDEAIEVYSEALERFPEHRWGIYNSLGHLFKYRGNLPEAETWYRKAADEDPEETASWIFLGSIQARQGNLKAAEESHRRATKCTEGDIDEAFHNLGLVLRGQGRFTEAAECFRKAIEITPEYKEAVQALEDVTRVLGVLGVSDG
jgi:tetratricopeptide (TPR) repeat protein